MDILTTLERKVLNSVSRVRNPLVSLGDKLNLLLSHVTKYGTPVNAIDASATLSISGAVIHGQKVTINNPSISGTSVFEFLADEAQSKSAPSNIAVDITDNTAKAFVILTLAAQPTSGDTMTLGSKIYTFVPDGTDTADGEVSVGTDLATAKAALIAAINGTDEFNQPHPLVSAGAFEANDLTITAFVGGVAGNSIASTENFSSGSNIFSASALSAGTDCSASDAVAALVASINDNGDQGVSATDGDGDTVVIEALVGGVSGNAILVSETLTNGAFVGGATHLAGGVDGTAGAEGQMMFDEDYIYLCTAANSVGGKNWIRMENTFVTF